MNKLSNQRDQSIDILRFLGLTCIMLAHVAPPNGIFQLRTFDVPMMVFISGLSYAGRSFSDYGKFVKQRLLRLLFPVYTFVTCFFLIHLILVQLSVVPQIPINTIIGTYTLCLNPSIGYLWIIRIFMIVMLITPLLCKISEKIKSDYLFIALIAALTVGQHLLIGLIQPLKIGRVADEYILCLAYAIPFLVGLRMKNATNGFKWLLTALFAAAFLVMAISVSSSHESWLCMQLFKYPPKVYFLLWGVLVSSILWCAKDILLRLLNFKLIYFVAQNTIWIYLWHIPFALFFMDYCVDLHWALKLMIVYGSAITLFSIQNRIVDYVDKKGWDSNGFIKKYFKG